MGEQTASRKESWAPLEYLEWAEAASAADPAAEAIAGKKETGIRQLESSTCEYKFMYSGDAGK